MIRKQTRRLQDLQQEVDRVAPRYTFSTYLQTPDGVIHEGYSRDGRVVSPEELDQQSKRDHHKVVVRRIVKPKGETNG